MTVRLEEQIRRYTEVMDAMAPPLDEMVPGSEPGTSGLLSPRVEVTIPLRPRPVSRVPGWVYAIAAAAAVLLLAVPIWLLVASAPDVADTTLPPPSTVPESVPPPGPDAFVYVDIMERSRTNGGGWAPGAPVRVSVDDAAYRTIGETDADGSFSLAFPNDVDAGSQITVEVGGVATTSIVPEMTITDFDDVGDRVLGTTNLPQEVETCCLSIFMFTSPNDNQAEEFRVDINEDGVWVADLEGLFDVTSSVHADVVYGDPDGLWLAWLDLRPEDASSRGPIVDPATGHYYQAIRVPDGITWGEARAAAENRTHLNLRGHLVTITSEAENEFLIVNLPQAFATGPDVFPYWLGGVQALGSAEPGGGWGWVTGEAWSYQNWADGEPNDSVSGEECLHAHHDPGDETRWNDQPCDAPIDGYIVEYSVES